MKYLRYKYNYCLYYVYIVKLLAISFMLGPYGTYITYLYYPFRHLLKTFPLLPGAHSFETRNGDHLKKLYLLMPP